MEIDLNALYIAQIIDLNESIQQELETILSKMPKQELTETIEQYKKLLYILQNFQSINLNSK
ncbi:MAG: hypothetical protein RLZ33_1572 [Bacteroidota bacterium]|jgi:hypothetical protein